MSLKLAPLFQDHAVFQREQILPIWGWAPSGVRIRAAFAGHEAHTISNNDGEFLLRLPAVPAGGPHVLTVEITAAGEKVEVRDILVGEVWLASGQSNMNWTMAQSEPHTSEALAGADIPGIRFFNVERRTHLGPHRTLDGRWEISSPAATAGFSAVAFSFARRLHCELGVPVGVVSSSWGGTFIQAWMSRSALAMNPAHAAWLASYEAEAWAPERWKDVEDIGADGCIANYPKDPGNTGINQGWHRPGGEGWKTIQVPATWQSVGHMHSGIFWFRRRLTIPASWAGRNLVLHLGAADKQDVTYVNGEEVGRTGKDREEQYWNRLRVYPVPGALVKGAMLDLAVRVYSFLYDGGLIGPAAAMKIHPEDDPGDAVALAGEWEYRCEHDLGLVVVTKIPGHGEPNSPHMLFDNMIQPLVPFSMRGAIWYQGESNERDPGAYRVLQKDLVRDWRYQWGKTDLAFHLVQLPGFRMRQAHQNDSAWARLREAQNAVLELPHTGVAVTIDLGQSDDIHPKDKIPVGERLAQSALVRTYGRTGLASGPFPGSVHPIGKVIRIDFSQAEGGLMTTDGALPKPFYIAGEDRVFHPAEARIEGGSVLVTSAVVQRPMAVRYAWADHPEGANVANMAGLPASPFRTDSW